MVDLVAPWPAHRSIKWSVAGPDEIAAWVAEMDFEVAPAIRHAVTEAVHRSDLGYAPHLTDPELAGLVSDWYAKDFGWSFDPGQMVLLPDVMRGVELGIELWSAPGEHVVVTTPVYPPFLESLRYKGRRLADAPLLPDGGRYVLDLDRIESHLAAGAPLVLLCNPHNPTGAVFTRAELVRLAEAVVRHDARLIVDEVHAPLRYPTSGPHVTLPSLGADVAARTLTVTSTTKAWNIPGLKCALALAGSAEMHRRLTALPDASFFGASPLGVHASVAALRDGRSWLDEVRTETDARRHELADLLGSQLPEVSYDVPEATYLAWVDCRGLDLPGPGRAAEFFLEHAHVRLSPGEDYGTNGGGRVRLNFATSGARLAQLVARLAEAAHHPPRTSDAKK